MKYRVVLESSTRHDIDAAYDWIKERAPLAAIKWFNGSMMPFARWPETRTGVWLPRRA